MSRVAEEFRIVDVDAHYADKFDDLVDYFDDDDPWKRRFKDGAQIDRGDSVLGFWPKLTGSAQIPLPRLSDGDEFVGRSDEALDTKESIERTMDELSFDKILLLSNQMLVFGLMSSGDKRQTKFANAYVDFMLDTVVDPDRGIYMAVPAPLDVPDEAAELIDRVRDEAGIVGVCLVTGSVEPPLGHRRYDPIYEAASDAGLPIAYHGASAFQDSFYLSGFRGVMEPHMLGFVWDNMANMTSILAEGIPEKYPDLDLVFLESGIFWIPLMMYRMDMEYMRQEWEAPLLDRRPSEYMREMYYGTQPLEVVPRVDYYEHVIDMVGGPDRFMYASDYPHDDYDDPSVITELPFLSAEEKDRILGGNAERVFGL